MALYLSGFTNVAVFNCRRSANVATIAAQFEAQRVRDVFGAYHNSPPLGPPCKK